MKQTRRNTEVLRLRVYGTVQGVGFRYFVRQNARHLSLHGYVRNLTDGSVELEAAGPPDALADLRRTVAHGPPGAAVTRIEDLPPSEEPLPEPFEIRR